MPLKDLKLIAYGRFVADFGRTPATIGVVKDVCWVTAASPACGMNGYVMIPAKGHPWSNGFPDAGDRIGEWMLDDVLDVHGGVTFAGWPWIGFDTAHAGDYWSLDYDPMGITRRFSQYSPPLRRWSPELVEREAQKLALQVAKIGERHREVAMPKAMSRFANLDVAIRNTQPTKKEGNQ